MAHNLYSRFAIQNTLMSTVVLINEVIYFYARVALKILFLNEPPGELRNRIFNATSA